jgi:hypothetical protein
MVTSLGGHPGTHGFSPAEEIDAPEDAFAGGITLRRVNLLI